MRLWQMQPSTKVGCVLLAMWRLKALAQWEVSFKPERSAELKIILAFGLAVGRE